MLLHSQLLHELPEDSGSRIRHGIDRMTHTIDQSHPVKCLSVHDLRKIIPEPVLILIIRHMSTDIIHHLHNLQVRAAMLRSLQGRQGRCHDRIGIGACRRNHAGGKCGIISSSVLCMQHQRRIQNLCLKECILFIRTQQTEDILRSRDVRIRKMDEHALVPLIMVVCIIAIHRQHGEFTDQLQTLLQHVRNGQVGYIIVIGRQRQHRLGHGIHDVLAGGFHDHVSCEIRGKGPK